MSKTIDINAETGEEVLREMTLEEIANIDAISKIYLDKAATEKKQEETKLSALAKLAALGLTADEINGLIS